MVGQGIYNADKDSILSKVSDVELAAFYIESLSQIPDVISSPLRKDVHPSFRVYSPDGTKVRWYDYVTGETGGMIDFIMKRYNCSFQDALLRINKDIVSFRSNRIQVTESVPTGKKLRIKAENPDFQIRTQMRDWEPYDFEYWASYGVPKEWLLHADIYPVGYIFVISETGFTRTVKADKFAYTFIERKDGKCTEKVYQPFNKEGYKWRSGHDRSVWDLWTKLPKTGDRVIITSSRKDALCLWAQTGIPSVSLQGEAMGVKPQVLQELKDRFKEVFVLFDNDQHKEKNYGRLDGERLSRQYGIYQIEIPSIYDCKDPSDLYHQFGGDVVRKVIYQLVRLEGQND